MSSDRTRYLLMAGVVYFACMAVAHFFGFRVPVLFVYYDTPYHAYQDKIIAFAVCAYIGLFYAAARASTTCHAGRHVSILDRTLLFSTTVTANHDRH